MDGTRELPIGAAADVAVHGENAGDGSADDQVVLHGAHEGGPPPPIVATDDKAARMLDSFPALTSAYASYIRARQVYVVDGNKEALYDAQKLVIDTMHNVTEFVDLGAALTLNDSVIEVQFEVLSRLGML